MKVMLLNDLVEELTNREVAMADSILELLHPDEIRRRNIFKSQLHIAVKDFCQHYPLVMKQDIPSAPYTFYDNFSAYIDGRLNEKDIHLIPQAIASVKASYLGKAVTRNNFLYDYSTHTLMNAAGLVTYYCYYPVVCKNAVNADFTEDSGVYFLDKDTSEGEMFIDQLTYQVLSHIMNTRKSVTPGFGVDFFDFSERLRDLQLKIDQNNAYSSYIYNIWSPTGV